MLFVGLGGINGGGGLEERVELKDGGTFVRFSFIALSSLDVPIVLGGIGGGKACTLSICSDVPRRARGGNAG